MKLHDITTGLSGDPNIEPLDMNQPAGSPAFFGGNAKFLTRKLWGTANEPPFFHHGMFTTLRQAVKAHDGEAKAGRMAFEASSQYEQDSIIEFLKTLRFCRLELDISSSTSMEERSAGRPTRSAPKIQIVKDIWPDELKPDSYARRSARPSVHAKSRKSSGRATVSAMPKPQRSDWSDSKSSSPGHEPNGTGLSARTLHIRRSFAAVERSAHRIASADARIDATIHRLLMLQLRHGIAPITSGNRSAFDERVRPDRPARVGEETPVTTTPHHVLWPARAAR